jgi:hypothetical protein
MIHAIIHHRSTFTGATVHGTVPFQFFDAADADEFMRKLDRSFPGIIHTWKSTHANPPTSIPAAIQRASGHAAAIAGLDEW